MAGTNYEELIAFSPRLCAGESIPFVHHADVYSAAPADLVGNFAPAQGTDKRVWYFLCPKKQKRGGRRPRGTDDGKGFWRGEAGSKDVQSLVDGRPVVGKVSTFSYGYRTRPPTAKEFKRLGWCMVEYVMDDARYGHVLCKVYRSPRVSAVLPPSSSCSKRKAAADGDHPESPPARVSPQNRLTHDTPWMPVQVQHGEGVQRGYVHEGPQPGDGAVHGGDTGLLIGAGISMEEEQAGIDYGELMKPENDQLAWAQVVEPTLATPPPDFHFFDDFFQEGLQPGPGTGVVHGGDTSSMFQELAGIHDGELPSPVYYDPLPWPSSPDYPLFFDDYLFGPN